MDVNRQLTIRSQGSELRIDQGIGRKPSKSTGYVQAEYLGAYMSRKGSEAVTEFPFHFPITKDGLGVD